MGVEMGTAGRCVLVPVSGLAAGLCEAEACGEPSRSVCSFFRKSKRSLFDAPDCSHNQSAAIEGGPVGAGSV